MEEEGELGGVRILRAVTDEIALAVTLPVCCSSDVED